MSRELFKGACPAVICPMQENGEIDLEAFDRLIANILNAGVAAVVINGTTGEGSTLTREEKITLVEHAVKIIDKKIPVIAGAGSNNTKAAIQNAIDAKNAGADGLLLVTPYYNKASQAGLIQHFEAIVNEVKLPSILYTVPGRTGMSINPQTVETLAKNPYIVGIKDATSNMSYTVEVIRRCKDLDFSVYSGEDRLVVPMIACGGRGVISVSCNRYPKAVETMCQYALNNEMAKAQQIMYDLDQYTQLLFADVNPIPIKAVMAHAGYGANALRLPLTPATVSLQEQLIAEEAVLARKGY